MKIIQTFIQFEEGSPYEQFNNMSALNVGDNKIYLNFYSFLLSCITLQKYYSDVTMFCNQKAYDSFIRYIPYTEIKIVESKNSFRFWNMSKIDAMETMAEKFIHVDSDVFIFRDCFSDFTLGNNYDVIVQDTIPPKNNFVKTFVHDNKNMLKQHNIIDSEIYDDRCVSCGTVGMTLEVRDKYVKLVRDLKYLFENNLVTSRNGAEIMIIEELGMHLLILRERLKVFEVLPYHDVIEHGVVAAGDMHKYTHMWINTKFERKYIGLIADKIRNEFPQYRELVERYESEIIRPLKILT